MKAARIVFPGFWFGHSNLQEAEALCHILACYLLTLAEACLADALCAGRVVLIVELHCFGLLGEGNAYAHLAHRIARARDGFKDCAEEDTAGSEHADVDDTDGFAVDDVRRELCALPALMSVGEDADVCLDHSRDFGIHIAVPPRRASLVGIGTGTVERSLGTYLIERLSLASDKHTLLDTAGYPGIEVPELDEFLFCRKADREQAADYGK